MAKTLKEITDDIAGSTEMSKAKSSEFVAWMNKYIKQELKKSKEFNLFGLGKLVVVNTAARKGINPVTGKRITIPASKRIKLRAGKDFKASINGK